MYVRLVLGFIYDVELFFYFGNVGFGLGGWVNVFFDSGIFGWKFKGILFYW